MTQSPEKETNMINLPHLGQDAKSASRILATLTTDRKNEALLAIAAEIEAQADTILTANALDIAAAQAKGLSDYLVDRLLLNESRVANLAADTRQVAALPDPVGSEIESRLLPNGMRLSRRRIPIGVIGVIYEARPNVTIDIATLALKTGNATILRGGKETLRSNLALVAVIQNALEKVGLPKTAVQTIANPDRALIRALLKLDKYVDMIIPRGGAALHRLAVEESTIPVITGGMGICHIFVDESAALETAVAIIENSKVQRPSVCNALDTLLVHPAVAPTLLPRLAVRLAQSGVELRATSEAYDILVNPGMVEPHFRRPSRRRCRRSHRLHPGPHHRTHRKHPHQQLGQRPSFCGRPQLLGRLCQRLHPLQRWRPIWFGRRSGRQHPEAPRPRPHGSGGTDHLQMDWLWRRAYPAVV